jgi:CSLREA domain-containing protein
VHVLLIVATLGLAVAAAVAPNALAATPKTYYVDSTVDQADMNPGDGTCSTGSFSGNKCTLRAAILEANAHPGPDTIVFGVPGPFALGIPVVNDDTPATGDFDIMDPVTIRGNVLLGTIIDGGTPPENNPEAIGMDRLFEIHPSARNVTFMDLTLREGFSDGDGAAIQNWSSGVITLNRVQVLRNLSGGAGAVNNADPYDYDWLPMDPIPMPPPGRIEITNSLFKHNSSGAGGSAINNASAGYISIFNSDIVDNPGPMIPDPLDPEEMIPAPGILPPDSSPIANTRRSRRSGRPSFPPGSAPCASPACAPSTVNGTCASMMDG